MFPRVQTGRPAHSDHDERRHRGPHPHRRRRTITRIRKDEELADILIVVWSVNPDHELPVDAYFPKPYGGPEIRDKINQLLAEEA